VPNKASRIDQKMRRLILDNQNTAIEELKRIGVDPDALSIFTEKSQGMALKFDRLSCAQVHILKQTALMFGADAAIPKTAYRGGRGKKFPLILFANRRQVKKIAARLHEQPWMSNISTELNNILSDNKRPILRVGKKKFDCSRTYIMGIINVTPDSFYGGSRYTDPSIIERVVTDMTAEGADFIDIGAESTRPGSEPVTVKEEIRRLKHVLPLVTKHTDVPMSVDTYKSKVAAMAIDYGASIINDISGLTSDTKLARVVAKKKATLVIMHMLGKPRTMQKNPQYKDMMNEIYCFLEKQVAFAVSTGVGRDRIIVDPGLGFGKKLEDNYVIMRRLAEFKKLQRPIMVGHSRKSFIGKPFKLAPENRLEGSLAVQAILIKNGASVLRVHDVMEAKRAAELMDMIQR
jgi:dihydropteroate synthase